MFIIPSVPAQPSARVIIPQSPEGSWDSEKLNCPKSQIIRDRAGTKTPLAVVGLPKGSAGLGTWSPTSASPTPPLTCFVTLSKHFPLGALFSYRIIKIAKLLTVAFIKCRVLLTTL